MADHQNQQSRIHPLTDVEATQAPSPTHPLFPRNTSKSDKNAADDHHSLLPPPLPRRTFPVSQSKPPRRKRSCFCKLLCWTFSLLLILIIAIAITIGILYLVFRPKLPNFSIDQLQVVRFSLTDDNLSAAFNVGITATNPNKKIGIYYEGGSHIEAWYEETKLCEGSLPRFYQGHRNTTSLDVLMSGQTPNATALINRLTQQEQETGNIPLKLKAKQPVRVKLGKLKLFKVKFRVRCTLMVDSITSAQNDSIRIQSSSCKFRGLRL